VVPSAKKTADEKAFAFGAGVKFEDMSSKLLNNPAAGLFPTAPEEAGIEDGRAVYILNVVPPELGVEEPELC
jgi:hypothetical protein